MTPTPHRLCLEQVLRSESADERRQVIAGIEACVAAGQCPRCHGGLREHCAWSRATTDRCVPVCSECGTHEALQAVTGQPAGLAGWPVDASEIRAQTQTVLHPPAEQ